MTTLRLVAAITLLAASRPIAAQSPASTTAPSATRVAKNTKVLPGARGSALTIIQGNALTSTNGPLTDTVVRLRDARTGRVVDTQTTDSAGLFAFRGVEPGSYIVEVVAPDRITVLTASQILNVDSGDAISAIVKLPLRIPPFAGILGDTSASSLAAITAQAATSGITAVTAVGAPTCALQ